MRVFEFEYRVCLQFFRSVLLLLCVLFLCNFIICALSYVKFFLILFAYIFLTLFYFLPVYHCIDAFLTKFKNTNWVEFCTKKRRKNVEEVFGETRRLNEHANREHYEKITLVCFFLFFSLFVCQCRKIQFPPSMLLHCMYWFLFILFIEFLACSWTAVAKWYMIRILHFVGNAR